MKINQLIFIKILLISVYFSLVTPCVKSQTTMKLNIIQTDELIVDAGSDATIDVGFSTMIGGSPTATGGTGNLTYKWSYAEYLNNSSLANPTAEPPGTVNFTVTVVDEKHCSAIDEIQVTVIGGTAVDEINSDLGFKIFPNPSSGVVTISINQIISSEVQIDIINLAGQSIHQTILSNPGSSISTDINLAELSKGSYILRISSESNTFYRHIILK